jgi:hypothetical protein
MSSSPFVKKEGSEVLEDGKWQRRAAGAIVCQCLLSLSALFGQTSLWRGPEAEAKGGGPKAVPTMTLLHQVMKNNEQTRTARRTHPKECKQREKKNVKEREEVKR